VVLVEPADRLRLVRAIRKQALVDEVKAPHERQTDEHHAVAVEVHPQHGLAELEERVAPHDRVDLQAVVALEQREEPGHPIRRAERNLERARSDQFAVRIDPVGAREGQDRPRIGVQRGHATLEEPGGVDVVVGRPFEVGGRAGEIERQVPVGAAADVLGVAVVADARVARGERAAYLLAAVGRGVVQDQELEVTERLRQQRGERRLEISLPVVDGDRDGDLRHAEFLLEEKGTDKTTGADCAARRALRYCRSRPWTSRSFSAPTIARRCCGGSWSSWSARARRPSSLGKSWSSTTTPKTTRARWPRNSSAGFPAGFGRRARPARASPGR